LLEFEGIGTEDNPMVIKKLDLQLTIEIEESKNYLQFDQENFNSFNASNSQNITFTKSKFGKLHLYYCSDIVIQNCDIDVLRLEDSEKITVNNSEIDRLYIVHGGEIQLSNSVIQTLIKTSDNHISIDSCLIHREKSK